MIKKEVGSTMSRLSGDFSFSPFSPSVYFMAESVIKADSIASSAAGSSKIEVCGS